jgi:hypothetical protein
MLFAAFWNRLQKGILHMAPMALILMSFLTFFTSGEDEPIREQILPVFGPIIVSLKGARDTFENIFGQTATLD